MSGRTSSTKPLGKAELQPRVAEAWSRVISRLGKGTFADRIGCCSDTVNNALTGPGLPEAHTLLNSLLADPTALDEVLGLYGMRIVPARAEAANDLQTIADLNEASHEWLQRLLDGIRCHRDTAVLAKMFRPLVAKMEAIIQEAEAA